MDSSQENRSKSTRRFRKRLMWTIVTLVFMTLGLIWYAQHRSAQAAAERADQFLVRFEQSFDSGLVELVSEPEIKVTQLYLLPGIGRYRLPNVAEVVVTAAFVKDGEKSWGLWEYTRNQDHDSGIYKFAYSTAPVKESLPPVYSSRQKYIDWATTMVDGIPTTVGPKPTKLTATVPADLSDPMIVTATAPPSTECRLEFYPGYCLQSQPAPQKPAADGTVKWEVQLKPHIESRPGFYSNAGFTIRVHCIEQRGRRSVRNSIFTLINASWNTDGQLRSSRSTTDPELGESKQP